VTVALGRSSELTQDNVRSSAAPRLSSEKTPKRPGARFRGLAYASSVLAAWVMLLLSPRLGGRASESNAASLSIPLEPAGSHRPPSVKAPASEPSVELRRGDVAAEGEREEEHGAEPAERADAAIRFKGYAHLPGGVLYVPRTFSSEDGAYDLLLHFHGNTGVVVESAEHAKLNAIVAVINLGTGSGPYETAYASPGLYEALLDRIERAVAERGLAHGRLRRVALSSWSAGYGALSSIFEWRTGRDPLDAILVLDGIHCGFFGHETKRMKSQNLTPFVKAAREAADGRFLFSITHSDVEPTAYASSSATADFLLEAVDGHRNPALDPPEHVELRAAVGAVSKKLEKRMEPESEAIVGGFHVRGYRGNTAEHHMAHLLQMAATVLPELRERWSSNE
jgi:hypothetical protein